MIPMAGEGNRLKISDIGLQSHQFKLEKNH